MGVLGESAVILIPSVNRSFGDVAPSFSGRSFQGCPPERIGVSGEYDYNGLANRVRYSFRQTVGDEVSRIKVRQRGCVVILTGVVSSRAMLNRLVSIANQVEGAALVEIYRIVCAEDELSDEHIAA